MSNGDLCRMVRVPTQALFPERGGRRGGPERELPFIQHQSQSEMSRRAGAGGTIGLHFVARAFLVPPGSERRSHGYRR
jgi:hypothetical protein